MKIWLGKQNAEQQKGTSMPEMITWENGFLSDRWELKVNGVLKGAVDKCGSYWTVTDAAGVIIAECATEKQAKDLLTGLVL